MDWNNFFHMGGYAFYVWTSWGLTTLVLLYLFTRAKQRNAKIKTEIERQLRREKLNDAH